MIFPQPISHQAEPVQSIEQQDGAKGNMKDQCKGLAPREAVNVGANGDPLRENQGDMARYQQCAMELDRASTIAIKVACSHQS